MKPNGFSFKNILTISTFGTFFFTMAALAGLGTGAGSLKTNKLSKQELSEAIKHVSDESGRFQDLPSVIKLDNGTFTQVEYTLDKELQEDMEDMFKVYQPDYGAFAAIDVETGKVLSLVSYNKNDRLLKDHLALRATFPSASVFKVVTASAAIAEKKMTADSIVAFNGRNHTLYKGNIFKNTVSRWTKRMSLKEAFGLSVNTVFAKLGAFTVGADELRDYAGRFGFNRKIASDLPIQEGRANIVNDAWSLAETASGYTRQNTMSPLQGALIASAVANDGNIMEPYVIQKLKDADGKVIYESNAKLMNRAIDASTASEMREMMRETVTKGTSRRSFKNFFKGNMESVDAGGKTGTLNGMDPKGKYDWFVGYARSGKRKIAVASLVISQKTWRVKSSYLARRAFEQYFKRHPSSL